MPPSLYIIDGSSYIYRAFYAIRQFLSNSKNLPTNAIYGFAIMLLKILKSEQPDFIAVALDSKGKTFRHEQFSDYKANRPEMPEDLRPQIPYIQKMIEAFNISVIQKEGFEADDIIGTLAKRAENEGFSITIVSGDKDLMQLISKNVRMLDTLKNKVFEEDDVKKKFGVEPGRVTDVMGLSGDSSDNIPGVPGIGGKTAMKLIQEFNTIENLIERVDTISKPSVMEKIRKYKDQAILSKTLSAIITDMDIYIDLDNLKIKQPHNEEIITLFKELEFSSLLKDFTLKADLADKDYHIILSQHEFDELLKKLNGVTAVSVDTETTSREPMRADIVGISLSYREDEAFYIPVGHDCKGDQKQLDKQYVFDSLKSILEDSNIKKYGQNIKYEIIVFAKNGIDLKGIGFDTMIASYLLNPSKRNHNLEMLALEHLDYRKTSYKEVAGEGAKEINFSKVAIKEACDYSCGDADVTLKLTNRLAEGLKRDDLYTLYTTVELPLIKILAEIEMNGVKIDADFLNTMSKDLDAKLSILIDKIYSAAGEEFNINSSKQLAEILFNKIGLKPVKRTKTGYSTNVDVLEQLADKHELPAQLLEYRQLNKLKSTYIDALPELINHETGRIHTSFNQTITATGRLSSSNPNLQNIPIRTELGSKIRKAFIADPGYKILSADYSQIELRILAHMSDDDVLIESFHKGEDIHRRTASEVMGIFPEMVTPDMRRIAKSVNFGIIYGISAYGLSRDLGISRGDAGTYIDNYFARYTKVRRFIDKAISDAYDRGFVTTLFNRRRYLPDLQSKSRQVKEFAERTAVNTPIQGTAADIIKIAMINISDAFKKERLKSKMVLQVHDELVFEVLESEEEMVKEIVKKGMEGVINLKVPILVDISAGSNWNEAH